jgi:hypothetical protein
MMKKKIIAWVCISGILLTVITPRQFAQADFWGADIPILAQILAKSIQQIMQLKTIIGNGRDTISILQDMNSGVKEVLRLANTAHIPLPKQVYDQANNLDQATRKAQEIYGIISDNAPVMSRAHYQSGVEGLYLSEDALEYSSALDKTGERVKESAVLANQAAATRLTAETLGVILEAIDHSSRIQAKNLEIASTERIENSVKESSRYESFLEIHNVLSDDLKNQNIAPLNSFGSSGGKL